MTQINSIIIDDESKARSILQRLLAEYCPIVRVLGEAEDVPSAVRMINKYKPDLIFLDIEMSGLSGLKLPDFFNQDDLSFEIIFVTAYSDYAIDALRLSAIDYLLKPVKLEELKSAVQKVVDKKQLRPPLKQRLESLELNLDDNASFIKIALPVSDGILFINSNEIQYLKADGAYTEFFLQNGSRIVVSKNLKEFERLLKMRHFVRPNRSYIVNLNCLKQLLRKDGGYLILEDDCKIHVSAQRREETLERLSLLHPKA